MTSFSFHVYQITKLLELKVFEEFKGNEKCNLETTVLLNSMLNFIYIYIFLRNTKPFVSAPSYLQTIEFHRQVGVQRKDVER